MKEKDISTQQKWSFAWWKDLPVIGWVTALASKIIGSTTKDYNQYYLIKEIVPEALFMKHPTIANNFPSNFVDGINAWLINFYANTPYVIRFRKEQPDLYFRLVGLVHSGWIVHSTLSHFQDETESMLLLYQAYKIMITYPEVESNHTLFR